MSGNPNGNNGNSSSQNEQRVVYSSSILFEKKPIEAMEALVIRRQQAKIINKELAEWFTAYGRLRLHYVDELKKIHKRGQTLFTDASPALQNQKLDALGLCNPLWSDTLNILNDEINLFDQSTRKMGRDMIAPLRLFTRNNDSNLAEMDELSQLAAKLAHPHGSNPEIYEDEWSRKAPYFFEIFENYDYQRLFLLKDIFLKYQTDVSDVLSKFKKDNENGLEHVLNFNVDDEIKRFSDDVIQSNIPIENIKAVDDIVDKSRTSTDGFTTSPSSNEPSATFNNHSNKRHSSLLSPRRFHIKKNDHENEENESNDHSKEVESIKPKGRRHTSSNSILSSNTTQNNDEKKKEKNSMRSKFGSIFKSHKKQGKESEYSQPATIHEPDSSSINTETTTNSSRYAGNSQRQRNQSVASNSNRYRQQQQQDDSAYKNEPSSYSNTNSSNVDPSSPRRSSHPYRESTDYSSNNVNSKPLPQYPENNNQSQQSPTKQPQLQQPGVQKKLSDSSLYEPMRPTKRSDSLSSNNAPQIALNSPITTTNDSTNINSASLTNSTGLTSLQPINRGMDNIPESAPLVSSPPPPPSSRKHIMSELAVPTASTSRLPHGNLPITPIQRRSVSNDQPLQPAATGTHQPESTNNLLAKNTTGGGSLMGGQIMHPSLTTPGLNSSIVELFNATFKDGKLMRSNAIGEVAFSYIVTEANKNLPSEIGVQITSKSNSVLPNFMVNPMFLQQKNTLGSFTISDPTQISMRTVGGLKYMLNNPTPPIVITPIWKHEDKQSTVIISIKPINGLEDYLTTESLTLSNVMVSVSIHGAIVSSAATKPSGSLNREKGRVTWILPNPITFNSSKKEERLVARFITNQKATESDTGVQVRFNISNEDGAGRIDFLNTDMEIKASGVNMVEDPFGDGINKQVDDWSEVPTLKSLVAGSYSGHS